MRRLAAPCLLGAAPILAIGGAGRLLAPMLGAAVAVLVGLAF